MHAIDYAETMRLHTEIVIAALRYATNRRAQQRANDERRYNDADTLDYAVTSADSALMHAIERYEHFTQS